MLYFKVKLDEERILQDNLINLKKAYQYIKKTYADYDVSFWKKKDSVYYFTRNKDKHDFEYLWAATLRLDKISWFHYYIQIFQFWDVDDETGDIYTDEDLMEEWDEWEGENTPYPIPLTLLK